MAGCVVGSVADGVSIIVAGFVVSFGGGLC